MWKVYAQLLLPCMSITCLRVFLCSILFAHARLSPSSHVWDIYCAVRVSRETVGDEHGLGKEQSVHSASNFLHLVVLVFLCALTPSGFQDLCDGTQALQGLGCTHGFVSSLRF